MSKSKLLTVITVCLALLVPIYGATALALRKNATKDFSVKITSQKSFSQPLTDLTLEEEQSFILGQRIFHEFTSQDKPFELKGIGPQFNSFNCAECHVRDGRGDPKDTPSLVIKLHNSDAKDNKDPIYKSQINTRSTDTHGLEVDREFKSYSINWNQHLLLGPLDKNTIALKRIAPETFGLGLVESIPENWFLSNEDIIDKDKDGISGRINWIKDSNGNKNIGRFGWKATKANIKNQSLHAAFHDLGLNNSLFNECSFVDTSCKMQPELNDMQENNLVFYIRALAPPASRTSSENEQKGQDVFIKAGCANCHRISAPVNNNSITKSNNGVIYPHSDFLLHSMGNRLSDPGNLNDIQADEFRTAPLWGLGLREMVNGSLNLLHDGRAKTIESAIDFHGGEAQKARNNYFNLTKTQKTQLLNYLNSL